LKVDRYLSPGSDLVALMVMEHQTRVHNLLTRANFQTRLALRDSNILNEALGEPVSELSESSNRRIQNAAESLVEAMLWSGETRLTDKLQGTSTFVKSFSERGLCDSQGRSLREFDLERRVFKYPCSYLIHSESFDGLPDEVRSRVYARLLQILTAEDVDEPYAHLTRADRQAILEILTETKDDLPDSWTRAAVAINE